MPSPAQFVYFQGGGFDRTMLSFLQVDRQGNVNVSRLAARPHVTAGAGGFIDITARARHIVFSGYLTAGGIDLGLEEGALRIRREGKVKKFVSEVEHVTFSGRVARARGQDVTFVTERCVLRLEPDGLVLTEVAPGVRLQQDVLDQIGFPVAVSPDLREMDAALFAPETFGLTLAQRGSR